MNFFRINNYLHVYEFPYYDYLKENQSFFDKYYKTHISESLSKGSSNVFLDSGEIYKFLNNKLLDIVSKNYYVSPHFMNHSIGIYKQDNINNNRVFHNHINSSSITAVFYLNPPKSKDGGKITFYFDNLEDPYTISPSPGLVYFFPSWVYHTPEPQTSSTFRFSFNWGYQSRLRPIHKTSADYW